MTCMQCSAVQINLHMWK